MTDSSSSGQRLGSAMGWAYAMDISSRVLGTAVTFILAALLGPEEFGLVALALVYVMFIDMLQRQGLSSAIVQRRSLDDDHLHSAFWMIATVSVTLTVGSVLLSGWWAGVNNTAQLQPVIIWLSALLPVNGLIVVQEAILRRQMRFRPLAVRNTIASLVGGLLGIAAAFAGLGVWALVVQQLSMATTKLGVLWFVTDWRPRLRFSRRHLKDLLSFSTGSFLTSLGVFVNSRTDAMLVGIFFGPAPIGLYRFAQRMMTQVSAISLAGPSMIAVALPALSERQHDRFAFTGRLRNLVHVAVVSSIPLFGILAAVAEPLLQLVGQQWLPAVWAIRFLCLVGSVEAVASLVQPVLQALGHPHRQAFLTWGMAAASAGAFVAVGITLRDAALVDQVTLLALSRAAVYIGMLLPVALWVLSRYGGLPVSQVLRICTPAIMSGGAGWLTGTLLVPIIPWSGTRLLDLATLSVTGVTAGAVAGAVLFSLDHTAWQLFATKARSLWGLATSRPQSHDKEVNVHG